MFFFFNDTATTEIYTLSLHDALPISYRRRDVLPGELRLRVPDEGLGGAYLGGLLPHITGGLALAEVYVQRVGRRSSLLRSEEHTSELQSRQYLVCRLLLEKKKTCISS